MLLAVATKRCAKSCARAICGIGLTVGLLLAIPSLVMADDKKSDADDKAADKVATEAKPVVDAKAIAEVKAGVDAKSAAEAKANPADAAMWKDHIEPILRKNCISCHGADKQKGGLDLRAMNSIMSGGTDGSVVTPGRPTDSAIYQRLLPDADPDEHMPPEKDKQLNAEEIALVKQWITTLPIPGHPAPGTTKGASWTGTAPSLMDLARQTKWSPPEGMQPSVAIDYLIESKWKEQNVSGSGTCDDATFVRRVYLDLAGRIPTPGEAEEFVKRTDSDKRALLVDQLLAGKDYPRRMAELFDVLLLERKGKQAENERRSRGWFTYLENAMAKNRPWNEIVADLILARPDSPETKGAVAFLYEQRNNHQQMAEAVAPIAFGVSIGCAQCHNHPLAHEIKQQNYWGLVAAFNRSTNADTNEGPALSESAIGGFVSFTNLKKESQPAILALLNDKTIDEQRPAEGAKEQDSDEAYLVPPSRDKAEEKPADNNKGKGRGRFARNPKQAAIPKFSRRQVVAEAVTHDNPLMARALVNRVWAMLLGRGIINPVSEMDSRHLPSHPELLAWLAQDFETSGYDVKRLVRNIVLSRTYQLKAPAGDKDPPAPELFACSLEKPLSAEVLYHSLVAATGNSETGNEDVRDAVIKTFPAVLSPEYNATLQQAAFLTNSPLMDRLLKPNEMNLTARLLELPSSEERVREMFRTVLGRAPDQDELTQSIGYLDGRKDRAEAAVGHLQWALLTSPEFVANH